MNFWICPSCSKKVSENMKGCPYCKTPNPDSISNDLGINSTKIIIGIMALIIFSGGAYFVTHSKEKNIQQPTPKYIVQAVNAAGSPPPETPATTAVPITSADVKNTGKTIPPSAMDAFKALKKLEAATQSGVSVKDYSPILIDAKLALNLFAESAAAKDFPALLESMKSAYETYKMAGDVWNDKFNGNKHGDDAVSVSLHPEIFIKYPELRKDYRHGGLTFSVPNGSEYLFISSSISRLFTLAGEELKKTSAMITM